MQGFCLRRRGWGKCRKNNVFVRRTSGADVFDDVVHRLFDVAVALDVLLHGFQAVNHGGVVPLEFGADGLHAHAGDLADDIYGHLARGAHIGVALFAADVRRQHVVGAGHLVDDLFDGNRDGLGVVEGVLDGGHGHADAGGDALQHIVGVELFDRALQLADVLFQVVGDIFGHVVGQVQVQQFRLALDDGHPGLEIRRLDVGGQAPLEPGAQALLQALDLLGGAVAGQHDLFAGVVQRGEGVEKLLLRRLLAGDELDVVDQQHVGFPVFLAELLGGVVAHRGDDLVGELFTVHVDDVEIGMVFLDLDLDGVEQVGLAQAGRPVDEQRVVGAGRIGRHRLGCRVGKLVGGTLDKVLEGKVVPARGQIVLRIAHNGLFRFGFRLGHHQLDFNVKAQHRLEGFLQQGRVPVGHDLPDEVVANSQRDAVGVFKADGLQPADVILIGGVRRMDAAIVFGRLQNVVERVHCIPHFYRKFSHSDTDTV